MLKFTEKAPMGWNSWDCWGAAVTEDIVRNNAQFMSEFLKHHGWEYVVVDIQWSEPNAKGHEYNPFTQLCMDEYSRLVPAENRFPSSAGGKGFAPLAEYIHSLGLKFGIHIMRGIPRQAVHENTPILGTDKTAREIAKTDSICAWNTDMYGVDPEKEGAWEYYTSLFKLYAEWGVDFIKCDDIAREFPHAEKELLMISKALDGCGRDMVFSISPGPAPLEKAELLKQISNMWRITDDFWDKWELLYGMFERCEKWSIHTGAGHWPDADMLPVGAILQDYGEHTRTQFSEDEQITMMTLWSIFRSPLFIGGDLTKCDPFTMRLLTNGGILKMHEFARNSQQVWRRTIGGIEHILWKAYGADGAVYAAIFNTGEKDSRIEIPLKDLELPAGLVCNELWSGLKAPVSDKISVRVPHHGAKAFRLANN